MITKKGKMMEDSDEVTRDEEFSREAELFMLAGHRYREYLKRHRPKHLAATVWVHGEAGDFVLYSETSRHAMVIVDAVRREVENRG